MGPFELLSPDGRPVHVVAKKSQALLAMLALAAGAPVPRSRLAAVLWGDRGEDQARNSLRQALTGLRKLFPEDQAGPLRITEESAAVDPAALTMDIGERDGALDPGEFLEGLHIPGQPAQEWLLAERQRLAALRTERLADRITRSEADGDTAGAVEAAQALIKADPLSEQAHRALMRGFAAAGDRPRALRQFQACRDMLKAELGVEPDAETQRLAEVIRAGATGSPATPAPSSTPPTVAVLPFANLSTDLEQEYFSDGITEDIITQLGRFRGFNVIARTSAFRFKGRSPRTQEIAEALGADYAVQGSIRKVGNRVRVAVQLAETGTGRELWAENFDRNLTDIFALQDEITSTVAGILRGRLEAAAHQRSIGVPEERLGAYDLCLRGKVELRKFKRDRNEAARKLLLRALELDPENAMAHSLLAGVYYDDWAAFWTVDRSSAFDLAVHHAERAVTLDGNNVRARAFHGWMLHHRGDRIGARSQFEEVLRLNPNDANALLYYASILAVGGAGDRAMALFDRAAQLDPFDAYHRPWLQGVACLYLGRYAEAIELLSSIADPIAEIRAFLAASYAQIGQIAEAKRHMAVFLDAAEADMAAFPGRRLEDWGPFCEAMTIAPENRAHFMEAFAKAWPD